MKLYVKNISFRTTDLELKNHFTQAGHVVEAKVVVDRATGKSKGFGFVTMPDDAADKAIKTLNQSQLDGRNLYISESIEKPRTERPYPSYNRS
jgi:RNA recognition motif-containing protein